MRQTIITLNLLGSFIVFALSIDLFDTLFMFLLFGILPNKSEPLSANQMLMIYTWATFIVASVAIRGSIQAVFRYIRTNRHAASSAS